MALIYVYQYLHRRYARPGKIECMAVHDKPVLDMLKKGKHSGSGLTFHEPVRVSNPQGLSATRATTQETSGGTHAGGTGVVAEWSLPCGGDTGGGGDRGKAIGAGGGEPAASYPAPI